MEMQEQNKKIEEAKEHHLDEDALIPHDASSIEACWPRIFFINGFLCFLENEWTRNGEGRERERRRHFKEKMSLEEAHHHKRPWIRAWGKKEMNEGRGGEEHEILCSK
ncbi:hypothetical protein GmHk_12G034929 [Glycine max]|nr:hypothetical protein GmHk_12G034929 [Glycine max]